MADVIQAERMPAAMPATVRAARFVLTLQVAFGIVGVAFVGAIVFASVGAAPILLMVLFQAAITALQGWLVSRWPSRRRLVRWGAVAVEVVSAGAALAIVAIDGDLRWAALLPRVLFPLAVVIPLLTPPAGRWFDR
ncbi:hypothetical protein [Nonomuraea sp. NPDC049695]|uniref:hypothetical protein n=1 Tax=Nonomuraea sp. NPDC049695 TaxID=3154734 RepID=UPI003445B9E7